MADAARKRGATRQKKPASSTKTADAGTSSPTAEALKERSDQPRKELADIAHVGEKDVQAVGKLYTSILRLHQNMPPAQLTQLSEQFDQHIQFVMTSLTDRLKGINDNFLRCGEFVLAKHAFYDVCIAEVLKYISHELRHPDLEDILSRIFRAHQELLAQYPKVVSNMYQYFREQLTGMRSQLTSSERETYSVLEAAEILEKQKLEEVTEKTTLAEQNEALRAENEALQRKLAELTKEKDKQGAALARAASAPLGRGQNRGGKGQPLGEAKNIPGAEELFTSSIEFENRPAEPRRPPVAAAASPKQGARALDRSRDGSIKKRKSKENSGRGSGSGDARRSPQREEKSRKDEPTLQPQASAASLRSKGSIQHRRPEKDTSAGPRPVNPLSQSPDSSPKREREGASRSDGRSDKQRPRSAEKKRSQKEQQEPPRSPPQQRKTSHVPVTQTESFLRLTQPRKTPAEKAADAVKPAAPPPEPFNRVLTLNQLRTVIEEIYVSKQKYDEKCDEAQLPYETMEQHVYTFLNQKYGLKNIILGWLKAIKEAVEKYKDADPDVQCFGRILSNDLHEGYLIDYHYNLKKKINQLFFTMLQVENPKVSEVDITELFQQRINGDLEEEEWQYMITDIYPQEHDRQELIGTLYKIIRENRANAPEEPVKLRRQPVGEGPKNVVKYSEFVQIVLDYQLNGHVKFLSTYKKFFNLVWQNNQDQEKVPGIISDDDFAEMVPRLDPSLPNDVIVEMLNTVDPFETGKITWSQCVSVLMPIYIKVAKERDLVAQKEAQGDDEETHQRPEWERQRDSSQGDEDVEDRAF